MAEHENLDAASYSSSDFDGNSSDPSTSDQASHSLEVTSSENEKEVSLGAQPYMFEPEVSDHSNSDSASDMLDEVSEGRLGNINWCVCGGCQAMATVPDCVCCEEIGQVSRMADSYDGAALNCITHHPGFEPVCLNRWFLDTAYLWYRQQCGGRGQNAPPNKKYRHTAYRQLTQWFWGHLRRMVHVPLLACAVRLIREAFPSEDGVYIGLMKLSWTYVNQNFKWGCKVRFLTW
ncbi:uncharacterized protein LOC110990950 [Acanthaster planci]|uniref:Uncharacterized protein LOC110990950 n=1 Tax=Acanthaster planci TaxID=133434 RepID=A0A8B8A200_ACAPL|nr:uncharacterized protein LOC110990950 [Acanthaster planci]